MQAPPVQQPAMPQMAANPMMATLSPEQQAMFQQMQEQMMQQFMAMQAGQPVAPPVAPVQPQPAATLPSQQLA